MDYFLIIVLSLWNHVIKVNSQNVFESQKIPFSLLNKLHIKSRPSRIEDFFFLNPRVLKKSVNWSLNNLYSTGCFEDIDVSFSADSETLYITTKDLFTASLFLDFAYKGELPRFGIGLEEHNLWGLLVNTGIYYTKDYNRVYGGGKVEIPAFLRPDIFTSLEFYKYKRGENINFSFEKRPPFGIRNAYSFKYYSIEAPFYFYQRGEIIDSAVIKREDVEVFIGRNLKVEKTFIPYVGFLGVDGNIIPGLRLRYKYFSFVKTEMLRKLGSSELVEEGLSIDVFLGKELSYRAQVKYSDYISSSTAFFSMGFNAVKLGYEEIRALLEIYKKINYFCSSKFSLTSGRILKKRDRFYVYQLGGTNGLRGYRGFYFQGSKNLLSQFELRFSLRQSLLDIVTPGMGFFIDAGYAGDVMNRLYFDGGFMFLLESFKQYGAPIGYASVAYNGKDWIFSVGILE